MNFERKPLSAGLYVVATPLGRARDITLTALDILASADVIACEDTRTTRKLMEIHGVPLNGRPLVAFHDHSGPAETARLISRIESGAAVACVSEAGTPMISDPGFELVRATVAAGLRVESAPGPSAVVAALSVGGLATDRFAFVGFLPAAQAARRQEIAGLRDVGMTLVIYESPKRVGDLLNDLCEVLESERPAAVCRELTKKFEEVSRGTLGQLSDQFADRPVKGEIVVLVGRAEAVEVDDAMIETALRDAMQTMRIKDAATTVAGALGLPRRQVYQMALSMKDDT